MFDAAEGHDALPFRSAAAEGLYRFVSRAARAIERGRLAPRLAGIRGAASRLGGEHQGRRGGGGVGGHGGTHSVTVRTFILCLRYATLPLCLSPLRRRRALYARRPLPTPILDLGQPVLLRVHPFQRLLGLAFRERLEVKVQPSSVKQPGYELSTKHVAPKTKNSPLGSNFGHNADIGTCRQHKLVENHPFWLCFQPARRVESNNLESKRMSSYTGAARPLNVPDCP
jgi:hypothetical protein